MFSDKLTYTYYNSIYLFIMCVFVNTYVCMYTYWLEVKP